MTRKNAENSAGNISISIPDFINATHLKDTDMNPFWKEVRKMYNAMNVSRSYENGNRTFNKALSKAIRKRGIKWFKDRHKFYAKNAYKLFVKLENKYHAVTGRFIKGWFSPKNSSEIETFIMKLISEHREYMEEHPSFSDDTNSSLQNT